MKVVDAPLRELCGALALLALFIFPLFALTKKVDGNLSKTQEVAELNDMMNVDVEVQSAHTLTKFVITRRGEELVNLVDIDFDPEVSVELARHEDVLVIEAEFVSGAPESALRLVFWPAGGVRKEFTLWGEGQLKEELVLNFHE